MLHHPAIIMTHTLAELDTDNHRYRALYAEFERTVLHPVLAGELKSGRVIKTSLHGSRYLNIAYPESDVDTVIVVDDTMTLAEHKILLERIRDHLGTGTIKQTSRTKLMMLTLAEMKIGSVILPLVEVTVYSASEYNRWYQHNTTTISRWTSEQRETYMQQTRNAHLTNNKELKHQLKSWAYYELSPNKILPKTE